MRPRILMRQNEGVSDRDRIAIALQSLVGLPLTGSGLAADMPTFQLGDLQPALSMRGEVWLGTFALHIQAPWCLWDPGRVALGPADTSWEHGRAPFLAVLEAWVDRTASGHRTVTSATADDLRGFTLRLSGGGSLDCMAESETEEEEGTELWRLFRPRSPVPHFVVLLGGRVQD